jgi:hypothetical protein
VVVLPPAAATESAAPTVVATAAPAPTAEPSAAPGEDAVPRHKVALTLRPGDPPCTLLLDGRMFEEHPEWFLITAVSRIATEDGGACSASVIYDVAKEKKRKPQDMPPEPLAAGVFQKPGQKLPPDMSSTSVWNVIDDLDFDGYADLCVVTMTGSYGYGQHCWIFDPSARTFKRHDEFDYLSFMTIDRTSKKITCSFRAGGPIYAKNEYVWRKGTLVQTLEETTVLGQMLDGKPLPKGFAYHLIRRVERNGRLVKTFDGPVRSKP